MKPSETIALQRDRLEKFRDLFRDFCRGDTSSNRDFDEVSIAAGAAQQAYFFNDGRTFPMQDARYVVPNASPISHWISVFDPESDLTEVTVISALNVSIGRAQERHDKALRRERGLVGLVAAVLRWPSDLRDAVGPGRGQRRAAQAIGVVGQVVVGVLTTALGTIVVQLSLSLWRFIERLM